MDILEKKYIDIFRKFNKEKRKNILIKIYNKYTSKKYLDREKKLRYGSEPEFYLSRLLILYGVYYGKPINDPKLLDDYFGEEKYLLEDTIYVSFIYCGLSDIFTISKK